MPPSSITAREEQIIAARTLVKKPHATGQDGQPTLNTPLMLRLYVVGDAPNSTRARANLDAILHALPPSDYRVEIVDIARDPLPAVRDGVCVTPTLVRVTDPPVAITGDLHDTARVLQTLGMARDAA